MRAGRGLRLFGAVFLMCLSVALASTVKVSDGDSLELRNAVLPDGTELEYYVVTGSPATITIDDEDQIIAEELEIDTTNNIIRIIGFGIIRVDELETQGQDLTFNLEDETFQGEDVLIVTEALDVVGADANRVPGQISVVTGRFSPCSRCEQQVEDYGFRAQRLELFPGDRLVAYDVNILIKGAPVFFLPILVLPLGPPDRQPRLSIEGGTATERAEAELVWPYIAGGTALGTVALQYYADVIPGEGNIFSNTFLGGRPNVNYLGGELNHRFYTDEGQGSFVVAYTPDFLEYDTLNGVRVPRPPDPDTPFFPEDEFRVRFEYASDPEREGPSTNVVVNRDDASAQRIVDYEVELADTIGDYEITLATQGFIDLQPDDTATPSASPRRSATLNIEPQEALEYRAGPFSLSNVRLNLGIFEARANANNRSAVLDAREENEVSVLSAGRLITSQTLRLDTIRPWAGLEIDANSSFTGQYYTTRNAPLEDEENGELERFINWNSGISLRQSLGSDSSLSLGFVRNINEGETPFAFDNLSLGSSTYLDAGLNVSPFAWLNLSANTRYLFVDSRSSFVGLDPLVTNLRLFDNLDWISLEFSNNYDFRGPNPDTEGNRANPGELRTNLTLNVPEPEVDASLTVTYVDDLDPTIARGRLNPDGGRDESELDISYRFGIPPYFSTDVSLGYQPDPPEVDEDEVRQFFKPFNAGFTFGSSDQSDRVPGLRIGFERDLNANETSELELEFTAALEPFTLRLQQDFDVRDERLSSSSYELSWNNVATFRASGFALLPPSVLGLELAEERTENLSYQIFEEREDNGTVRWRVEYLSDRVYELDEDEELTVEARNSRLDAFVNLDESRVGGVTFGVDFDLDLRFQDDSQSLTYLERASLDFFSDFYSRVGIQGELTYAATLDNTAEELSRATLGIDNLAFTVQVIEGLYVSSIFNDTFTFAGEDGYAFNFQPEFRVTWDRCCWALLSSWDTATGQISITLTTPGSDENIGNTFDTELRLRGEKSPVPAADGTQ